MRYIFSMYKGLCAVYKPKGITSYDVIREIKKHVQGEKIGHAGTLDPLAEGVLVIAIGREATKHIADTVAKEKEYIAEVKLGVESATDDEEGEKTIFDVAHIPDKEIIEKVLASFIGTISQTPPPYSAIKIDGKEAYKYMRADKEVEMKPREVIIKEIELLNYEWPILSLRVVTGPGVYIRSLARDIGRALQTGGYLTGLVRTRVGDFALENAIAFGELSLFLEKQI